MKYERFCEYAKDNYFQRLFNRVEFDEYKCRVILKAEDNLLWLIGEIEIDGTFSERFRESYKSLVAKALNSEFVGLNISSCNVRYNEKIWFVEKRPSVSWNWEYYQWWLARKMPISIMITDSVGNHKGYLDVQTVDFNVTPISKDKVPESWVRKNLCRLRSPTHWLPDISEHFLRGKVEYDPERVGVCSFYLFQTYGVNRDWRASNCWDVPNNNEFIKEEFKMNDLRGSGCLVYLPFISLPCSPHSHDSKAMAFDLDDFLPNPKKRRVLFDLIKLMDRKALDKHFSKQKLIKYTRGSLITIKKNSLAWKKARKWEKRWLKLKAVTSHQPNTILGQVLLEEDEIVIKFTLKYFSIDAKIVNQLKIGIYYAVEMLARVGRLLFVSSLVQGRLKLSGEVLFLRNSFRRVWSAVFAAIEVNNVKSLGDALALDEVGRLLHLRGECGITPLGLSVLNDQPELVQVLLDALAMVDQPSWGDETALGLALQFSVSTAVVKKLIQAGAKLDGQDLTGNSIRAQLEKNRITVR